MLWPPGEGGQDKAAAAVCMWPMRGGNGDRVEARAMSGLWRDWDGPAHGRHGPQSLFLLLFIFYYFCIFRALLKMPGHFQKS